MAGDVTVRTAVLSSKGQNEYDIPAVTARPLGATACLTARQTGHLNFHRTRKPGLVFPVHKIDGQTAGK